MNFIFDWNKQYIKQLLDEVSVIFRIIEVEVGVISRSRRLRLITPTETSIILDITKTESNNCFIIHWTKKKIKVIFFASSLTPSSTKRANLTWLPWEIMHRGHTWHDYPWPGMSLTWLLYNLQLWCHRRCFRPIRKELARSMYNNTGNCILVTGRFLLREHNIHIWGNIHREYYMPARGYEFYLRVFSSISIFYHSVYHWL